MKICKVFCVLLFLYSMIVFSSHVNSEAISNMTFGEVKNNTYYNPVLGIGCTLDDSWFFYDHLTILEGNDISQDLSQQEVKKELSKKSFIVDMVAERESVMDGDYIIVSAAQKNMIDPAIRTVPALMENSISHTSKQFRDYGLERFSIISFDSSIQGAETMSMGFVTEADGMQSTHSLTVFENGDYLIQICINSMDGIQEIQSILSLFFAEKPADPTYYGYGAEACGVYWNSQYSIGCKLDENWQYLPFQTLSRLNNYSFSLRHSELPAELQKHDHYYDTRAINDTQTVVMDLLVRREDDILPYIQNEYDYTVWFAESWKESMQSKGVENPEIELIAVSVAGMPHWAAYCAHSAENGTTYSIAVPIKYGNDFFIIQVYALNDDVTQDMLDCFFTSLEGLSYTSEIVDQENYVNVSLKIGCELYGKWYFTNGSENDLPVGYLTDPDSSVEAVAQRRSSDELLQLFVYTGAEANKTEEIRESIFDAAVLACLERNVQAEQQEFMVIGESVPGISVIYDTDEGKIVEYTVFLQRSNAIFQIHYMTGKTEASATEFSKILEFIYPF